MQGLRVEGAPASAENRVGIGRELRFGVGGIRVARSEKALTTANQSLVLFVTFTATTMRVVQQKTPKSPNFEKNFANPRFIDQKKRLIYPPKGTATTVTERVHLTVFPFYI